MSTSKSVVLDSTLVIVQLCSNSSCNIFSTDGEIFKDQVDLGGFSTKSEFNKDLFDQELEEDYEQIGLECRDSIQPAKKKKKLSSKKNWMVGQVAL